MNQSTKRKLVHGTEGEKPSKQRRVVQDQQMEEVSVHDTSEELILEGRAESQRLTRVLSSSLSARESSPEPYDIAELNETISQEERVVSKKELVRLFYIANHTRMQCSV